jgi:ABC-type transporter Mla MlaB component
VARGGVWHGSCHIGVMLRITIHEKESEMELVLEGRVAGPWVEELDRVWVETAPRLGSRKLSIDLRNVTYADSGGKRVLRDIFSQSGAELVANSLGTQDLAGEVTGN